MMKFGCCLMGAPPTEHPKLIRNQLTQYDFKRSMPLKKVICNVVKTMQKWNLDTSHRRYMGLFNGPAHFSSIIADALVAMYNPQLSAWSHGAAANEIELHLIQFFLKKFGLDIQRGFGHFTSGGSASNTTALLCALNKRVPGYKSKGLVSFKQRPLLYVSEYTHHSIQKAACSTGLGMESIRMVPTDESFRIHKEGNVLSVL